MKKFLLAAVAAFSLPVAAHAQDQGAAQPTAPDGSKAFGFEPYVGILGGYDNYDRHSDFGIGNDGHGKMDGALIEGVAGFNLPLGPAFVGVEGNAAKGFKDIDWEYGVRGRIGARAGETGMIYASAGYEWVNGRAGRGFPDRHNWVYGLGVEAGPKMIGINGIKNEGVRLRLQVDTYDFQSIRPMAGIVFHL